MAKTIKEEKLRWILPIIKREIKLVDVAKVCPHSKRSLERWVAKYKDEGEEALEPKSTRPKTSPKETPIRIKERVIELRKQNRKCALKLHWQLEDEGISLHHNTIQKIIKTEGLTRKYRTRKPNYKKAKIPFKAGELVEIDVKYVPDLIENKQYFQYTAIDCASRQRFLEIYDDQSTFHACCFLQEAIKRFKFNIKAVKTDNHSIFTNRYVGGLYPNRKHEFDRLCDKLKIFHYLISPGKPAQNGRVERSHRSDQESFYDLCKFENLEDLRYQARLWNMYYNDLAHCSLGGKSPNQFLKANCPPNVYG